MFLISVCREPNLLTVVKEQEEERHACLQVMVKAQFVNWISFTLVHLKPATH